MFPISKLWTPIATFLPLTRRWHLSGFAFIWLSENHRNNLIEVLLRKLRFHKVRNLFEYEPLISFSFKFLSLFLNTSVTFARLIFEGKVGLLTESLKPERRNSEEISAFPWMNFMEMPLLNLNVEFLLTFAPCLHVKRKKTDLCCLLHTSPILY